MKKKFLIKGYNRKNKQAVEIELKAKNKKKAKEIANNKGISVFKIYELQDFKEDELIDFFENFLILLKAKTNIKNIFEIMNYGENKARIELLYQFIKEGYSLSDSLKFIGAAKNPFIEAMLKAGENSGNLENSINNILNYLKMKKYVTDNLKSAMIYPSLIIGASIITILVVLLYIVPAFENLYSIYGDGNIPFITSILITLSHFIRKNTLTIVLISLLIIIIFFNHKKKLADIFISLISRLPGAKKLIYYFLKHQQFELLFILTEGKIKILDAILLLDKIPLASIEKEKIQKISEYLKEGIKLSTAFEKTEFTNSRDINIVKSGESSGNLLESFKLLSLLYKKKIDSTIFLLTKLTEPLFILAVGILVGFILISLYLPLFDMSGILK